MTTLDSKIAYSIMKAFWSLIFAILVCSNTHAQSPVLSFNFEGPTAGVKEVGKVTTEPGIKGQAGTFDGASWIEVPFSPNLNNKQWSISAWACPQQERCGGRIIEKGASNSFWLTFYSGFARFGFYSKEAGYQEIDSASRFRANEWRHVAGTYDGQTLRLYVDGKLEAMKKTDATPNMNKQPLAVGAKPDGVAGDCFIGALDEVVFYNRVLSETEISSLSSPPKG